MAGMEMEMELTSGASGRIIPVFKNIREAAVSLRAVRNLGFFLQAFFLWIVVRFRHRSIRVVSSSSGDGDNHRTVVHSKSKRRSVSLEEEDALNRRALAEEYGDESSESCWQTLLFVNSRRKVLFTRSWTPPASQNTKGLIVLLHGLNEHSGRYDHFARQLNSHGFGVYAMDWIVQAKGYNEGSNSAKDLRYRLHSEQ